MGRSGWIFILWCGATAALGQDEASTCEEEDGTVDGCQPVARVARSLLQGKHAAQALSVSAQGTQGTGHAFTKEQVVECFQEETKRLERQGMVEGLFGALGALKPFNPVSDFVTGVATAAHAVENAKNDNCLEKGFESVLAGMDDVKGILEGVETQLSENHDELLAGQSEILTTLRGGVARIEGRLSGLLQETLSFRDAIEEGIGKLDQEITGVVRNQNTLSLQLDHLSLQLYGTEQRLMAEQYSKSAVSVVSAAKMITRAIEDIQDSMVQVYDHRSLLPSLALAGAGARLNAVKWASTEKRQMIQLQEVVKQAWGRSKDALSLMAVTLSEGDFLRKYFLQALRISANSEVESRAAQAAGKCGGIMHPSLQPLLSKIGNTVLAETSRLMEVISGSVVQVHDVFKTMVLVFGRHGVSPIQYKDSLITIKHALEQVELDFSDADRLLSAVQDMISPVMAVHCPLSPTCRHAAFLADSMATTSRGVQYDERIIAFEPLSHIGHGSEDSAFYSCEPLPMIEWASFDDTNPRDLFTSRACRSNPREWKVTTLKCPDGYELKFEKFLPLSQRIEVMCLPDGCENPQPACDARPNWGSEAKDDMWWIGWGARDHDPTSFPYYSQAMKIEHIECQLKGGKEVSVVTRKTGVEADNLVDTDYTAWSLGGSAWKNTTSRMRKTLDAAIEDSFRRLFLISNQQKCAESLPHGKLVGDNLTLNWNLQEPFFCWDCAVEPHEQWMQEVTVHGHPERSFRLVWKFKERLTVSRRLEQAVTSGISVEWDAFWGNGQKKSITGTFRFSRTAARWAAYQYIDGHEGHIQTIEFGHGNQDGKEGSCSSLWVDGKRYDDQVFTSRMYVVY